MTIREHHSLKIAAKPPPSFLISNFSFLIRAELSFALKETAPLTSLHIILHFHGDEARDALLYHGDALQGVGKFHRLFSV